MMTSSLASNPYKMGEVDYFDHSNVDTQNKGAKHIHFDFREPFIDAEGKVSTYTPPSIVLTLLETPTLENARAYISWQQQKVEKISKAQQVIEKIMKEEVKK
jgi:hypothetical protein